MGFLDFFYKIHYKKDIKTIERNFIGDMSQDPID